MNFRQQTIRVCERIKALFQQIIKLNTKKGASSAYHNTQPDHNPPRVRLTQQPTYKDADVVVRCRFLQVKEQELDD